ncbi:MAG: PqqD family protein [Desulfobacterales bacterium]|nr:PqqD family protein [Desulfobacterales bacterium]
MQTTGNTNKRFILDGQQVYTLSAHILFATFGQGGVIFNLDTRESLRLNPTAASVIKLLNGHRSISAITDILSQKSDVKMDRLKTDVAYFIEDIINRGWINAK